VREAGSCCGANAATGDEASNRDEPGHGGRDGSAIVRSLPVFVLCCESLDESAYQRFLERGQMSRRRAPMRFFGARMNWPDRGGTVLLMGGKADLSLRSG